MGRHSWVRTNEVKTKALSGLRVVDFSENLPGPYTSLWLWALGAEVIKVERPGGDPAHRLSKLYEMLNHPKTIKTFDLKNEADREKVKALILSADVVVAFGSTTTLPKKFQKRPIRRSRM